MKYRSGQLYFEEGNEKIKIRKREEYMKKSASNLILRFWSMGTRNWVAEELLVAQLDL